MSKTTITKETSAENVSVGEYYLPLNPLTDEELKKLLDKAKQTSVRNAVMIKMIATTGATPTEIIMLDRADLHLSEQTALYSVDYRVVRRSQKPRTSLLDLEGSELMSEHLDSLKDYEPAVFRGLRGRSAGERLDRKGLWGILNSYSSEVGRVVNSRSLRDFYLVNFSGRSSDLQQAIGTSRYGSFKLMSRKANTPASP